MGQRHELVRRQAPLRSWRGFRFAPIMFGQQGLQAGIELVQRTGRVSVKPERTLLRCRLTGTRINGARYRCPAQSSRVQERKPRAK